MFSLDGALRILVGVGLIVSLESVLRKALMVGISSSIGLNLRGLVALMESSSNSTLWLGFPAGVDMFLSWGLNQQMYSSLYFPSMLTLTFRSYPIQI